MKRFFALFGLLVGLGYGSSSMAQLLDLSVTDYGLAPSDPSYATFKALIDDEIAKVEADINKNLPSAPPKRLMEGMANSSVMAGKGIGTDYASNMDVALIGAGIGAGADLAKDKNTKSDLSGVGVAPGVVVGMNLGFLDTARILGMDTNRMNFYVNYMSYNYNRTISNDPGKESSAKLGMTSFGSHIRYDWIRKRGSKLLGWGGVKFTFGYEYNKTNIQYNGKINEAVNASGSGYTVTGNITGSPSATIQSATHSFPAALSTDVQLLYILSLYGGLGMDYNLGYARGKGNLNADPSTVSCSGGAACTAAGNPNATVQARANVDATGKVTPLIYRGFAGVQINLPFIRIFGQVDKAFGNDLIGATAGVRFVY